MEWGWMRDDCIRQIKAAWLPQPGKTSCFFCPSMKPDEITALREQHPDLFRRAMALERNARKNLKTVKGLRCLCTRKTYEGAIVLADTGGKYVNYRIEKQDESQLYYREPSYLVPLAKNLVIQILSATKSNAPLSYPSSLQFIDSQKRPVMV